MNVVTPAAFWEQVAIGAPDECWPFLGPIGSGYGLLVFEGRYWSAHRLALTLAGTPIPDGMLGCHRCDVAFCCNPQHLFVGTHADNQADYRAKQRGGDYVYGGRVRSAWRLAKERRERALSDRRSLQ